jgi:hypothetical protein
MNGDEGKAKLFMRDVRGEELPLGSQDRFRWVKGCDDLISGLHDGKDNPIRKYFEALIWTPKIGVLNNRLIIFRTAETEKFQPSTARLGFKILAGNKDNAETALFQFLSNADKWVDIACAANSAEEDRAFSLYAHKATEETSDFFNKLQRLPVKVRIRCDRHALLKRLHSE